MSKDKQGTHPIQALIEVPLSKEEENLIFLELKDHFAELSSVTLIIPLVGSSGNSCNTKGYIKLPWIK